MPIPGNMMWHYAATFEAGASLKGFSLFVVVLVFAHSQFLFCHAFLPAEWWPPWEFIIHQCTLLVKQCKSIVTSYIHFVILTCTLSLQFLSPSISDKTTREPKKKSLEVIQFSTILFDRGLSIIDHWTLWNKVEFLRSAFKRSTMHQSAAIL